MRERLLIRLRNDTDLVDWAVLDESGTLRSSRRDTALSSATDNATGRRLVLIVPGNQVLLTAADIPSRKRQQIARALPYALEEQLASDVENLHFAQGGREADGRIAVAVTERTQMDSWLGVLREEGLHPAAAYSETLALPIADGEWSILLENRLALIRTGLHSGFTADPDNLAFLLNLALQEKGDMPPSRLRIYDCREDSTEALWHELGVEVVQEACPDGPLGVLIDGLNEKTAIDLMQDDYGRDEEFTRLWRPWRPAAAMLTIWLLFQGGLAVADYQRLSHEKQAFNERIEALFREAFPDVRRVVDPRVQMERRLKALRGESGAGGGFLSLLTIVGAVLKDTPSLQLTGASFREGRLDLDVLTDNLQTLDAVKQALSAQPELSVELQSASAGSGQVEGRLRIQKAG